VGSSAAAGRTGLSTHAFLSKNNERISYIPSPRSKKPLCRKGAHDERMVEILWAKGFSPVVGSFRLVAGMKKPLCRNGSHNERIEETAVP
jgi:hypothetical protein